MDHTNQLKNKPQNEVDKNLSYWRRLWQTMFQRRKQVKSAQGAAQNCARSVMEDAEF